MHRRKIHECSLEIPHLGIDNIQEENQEYSLGVAKESGLYCAEALDSSIAEVGCGRKLPVGDELQIWRLRPSPTIGLARADELY